MASLLSAELHSLGTASLLYWEGIQTTGQGAGEMREGPTAGRRRWLESHPHLGAWAGEASRRGSQAAMGPPTSFSKNQEVTERKKISPPLTQGLLSSFENDVRKEKAELKRNTEESQIHA